MFLVVGVLLSVGESACLIRQGGGVGGELPARQPHDPITVQVQPGRVGGGQHRVQSQVELNQQAEVNIQLALKVLSH